NSINALAQAYFKTGRSDEAIPLFEEAVRGGRKYYDLTHPRLRIFVDNLAEAYEHLAKPAKAEPLRRELAESIKQTPGIDSPEYADALDALGVNLLSQNKAADAESTLRTGLAVQEKKQPSSWLAFNTQSMLGESLLLQKKYAEAEAQLLASYEGFKQREADIPAEGRGRVTETLGRLVQLYVAWEKPDKAAEWRKKLEEQKK